MALPSSGQLGGTPTNAQFQGYIEDLRDVVSNQIGGAGRTELTIATGAVTPPARDHGGVFKIDTEGNAASDTLDTITQTNTPDGTVIVLMAEDAARVVTLNHAAGGSGQMLLTNSTDFVFASLAAWVMLQRRSTDWVELQRYVPPEDLTALSAGPLETADLLRIWDDSAGTEKRISAKASATLAGLVELATNAEALAGSDTERAVTPGNLASDQTKAAKGHMVLPGNLLLVWGKITFVAATGPATDTFTKAFSGTPYSVTLGSTMNNTARVTTFSTTTVGVTLSGSGTGDVYYQAIGPA